MSRREKRRKSRINERGGANGKDFPIQWKAFISKLLPSPSPQPQGYSQRSLLVIGHLEQ